MLRMKYKLQIMANLKSQVKLQLFILFMQIYPLPRTSHALKQAKNQNIRLTRAKRTSIQQFNHTPLQVLPKSLNKIMSHLKQTRMSRSSRKSYNIQFKSAQEHQFIIQAPPLGIQLRNYQSHSFNHTVQINPQQRLQKKNSQKKKSIARQDICVKRIHIFKSRKCMCGDCEQCLKDFTYFLQLFSNDQSIPQISAKSWCVWRKNKNHNKFIHYYGKRIHKVRQIASLTKIVTSMTTMDYLQKYDLDPQKITYQIRKPSIMVGGTSAKLQLGQIYTISQLLYALMLPSGNDAAVALSQAIGLLHFTRMRNKNIDPYKQEWYAEFLSNPTKSYSYLFIALMNEKCQKLGLLDTHMYNSHGNDAYDQLKNVSTCNEIAKMSGQYMMKYDYLKNIVTTKSYRVQRYSKSWDNTNKLIDEGFEGIKTGITDTAGPCLSACYKDYIIIVLNSKSMNQRWIQVKKLVKWIVKKNL